MKNKDVKPEIWPTACAILGAARSMPKRAICGWAMSAKTTGKRSITSNTKKLSVPTSAGVCARAISQLLPTMSAVTSPRPMSIPSMYKHGGGSTEGFSVTGGYVYRGPIKELQGRYFSPITKIRVSGPSSRKTAKPATSRTTPGSCNPKAEKSNKSPASAKPRWHPLHRRPLRPDLSNRGEMRQAGTVSSR